ncbi:MAG TPA: nucleotide exchange factor GrpE [Actinomycetota bacterium]|nr:nucleotide exchange factor GrpE [Actinomycetota bacterium]
MTDERHEDRREEAAARQAAASDPPDGSQDTEREIADAFDSRPPDVGEADTQVATEEREDPLAAARGEAAQYREHLQRLQAEFENYRKRVLREQTQAVDLAARPVIARLLEVLDDFDLALMHAQDRPDFDRFLHGVELVYAKLVDTLRAEGLERIEARGKPFDPELHEALMQSGEGDGDPVVADVLRPGYTMKGRVLRPAGVRVERQ